MNQVLELSGFEEFVKAFLPCVSNRAIFYLVAIGIMIDEGVGSKGRFYPGISGFHTLIQLGGFI